MRNFTLAVMLLLVASPLFTGCEATKSFLLHEEPTGRTYQQTNYVTVTNPVTGETERLGRIDTIAETRYVPNPDVLSAVDIGASFAGPYGTLITGGLSGGLALLAGWLNRKKNKQAKTAENAVASINQLLGLIGQIEGGEAIVKRAKEALRKSQLDAGVWDEVNAILKRHGLPKLELGDLVPGKA